MNEFLVILLAYGIGSIPSAVIISKVFFGIDIRDYGSGNMGATNTFRVLGPKFGTIVMLMDMLKGIAAVKLYLLLPYHLAQPRKRPPLHPPEFTGPVYRYCLHAVDLLMGDRRVANG